MKHLLPRLATTLALLAFALPALAQQPMLARIEAHPALWTVHGKAGTAYLLGSIHLLPVNVAWHTPQIDAAMAASDVFVFEIPMDAPSQAGVTAYIAAHGTLPKGETLPALLPPAARKDYQAALARSHIPPQALDDKRPWLASIVLQVALMSQQNYSASGGIDHEVLAIANARGKALRHFETVDQQMALLAPPDQSLEVKEFALDLKSIRDQPSTVGAIVDAWASGDVRAIDRLMNSDLAKEPGAKKALLDDRNRNWVAQLDNWLDEPHTYFITVGAAHLAGPNGVPALLRAQGIKVDGP
ncbi:MAG TPA: TraB/GumN family protein [Rhizomicrobium sp.]|nr:TraB/GumN family protein [Rhizomicrobium sp.]